MKFTADLHIHSKYSYACSKSLTLPNINQWAKIKGIDVISTADFTHPRWFENLAIELEEAEEGLYRLKDEYLKEASDVFVPKSCEREIRFILSTEISLIYKRRDKVRKVHYVVLAPSLAVVAQINRELSMVGNLNSDGRPILGLDSRDFLEILMYISPDIQVIPAHVWTPHFAIFGSKSGFDSVEECFGDLAHHITAFETGLSSDPLMNYRLSQNDRYALISSSDAHSLKKLGREATVFDCEKSYFGILDAIRKDHSKIYGTIEFYPEEGKYHADGLRAENLVLTPKETKKLNFKSPNSGKNVTVGVLHRVDDLADREMGEKPESARSYWYIIPLAEILSEILMKGVNTKTVQSRYFDALEALGSEFYVLKDAPVSEIKKFDTVLAEAIKRMREGNVIRKPGYDGEFGEIKLFNYGEISKFR